MDRERSFSISKGGPAYHVMVRLGLRTQTSMARCWWLGILIWLPLVAASGVRLLFGRSVDPMLLDLSVHVRVLVALPLLLFAERLLDETCASAMRSFHAGRFFDQPVIAGIEARAERMRDLWWVEAALLAIALAGGQLVLWRITGPTGVFHGGGDVEAWTFTRLWYAVVAFPLVQFVMLRWLWRWLIWTRMLAQLARLPLRLLATHADRAGGLTPLARPMTGFSGFVLAASAILAAAWASKILGEAATVGSLLPALVAFLLIALAVAVVPLLAFTRHLFRARRRALAQYGDFVRDYTLRFHDKWIDPGSETAQPLGTPDIQSLADVGNAYQVIQQTRVFVFGSRNVFLIWASGILPMIPLFASSVAVEAVLKRIISTILVGVPL